jgi:hypothetical protein
MRTSVSLVVIQVVTLILYSSLSVHDLLVNWLGLGDQSSSPTEGF